LGYNPDVRPFDRDCDMKIVIQFTAREELRALPILLRHSQGMVLRDRVYIVDTDAVRALIEADVRFTQPSRDADSSIC
jgi:hypothetical protein